MKSLKYFLVFFLLIYIFGSFKPAVKSGHPGADIRVYNSYTDYLNGKFDKMDDVKGYSGPFEITLEFIPIWGSDRGNSLVFILKDKITRIKCEDIWGFKINQRLFRIDHRYEEPVALVDSGKLFYYENGPSYLNSFIRNTDYITSSNVGEYTADGNVAYLSQTINSEIFPLFCAVTIADMTNLARTGARKKYHTFMKKFPMHKSLYDCMEKSRGYTRDNYAIGDIRNCITDYIGYPKNNPIPDYK